jgi:hypothetical protein
MSILFIVLAILVAVVVTFVAGAIVALVVLSRRRAFQPPAPAGEARRIRMIEPGESPITATAVWRGNELEVTAESESTARLFEVPVSSLEQCMITWRFRISTIQLASLVYAELWCRIAGMGEFFSRALNQKLRGDNDSVIVELHFYLKKGQQAELLKLNMAFEGPGCLRLRDLELLATPLGDW